MSGATPLDCAARAATCRLTSLLPKMCPRMPLPSATVSARLQRADVVEVLGVTAAGQRRGQAVQSALLLHVAREPGRQRRHECRQRRRGLVLTQAELPAELLDRAAVLRREDGFEQVHGASLGGVDDCRVAAAYRSGASSSAASSSSSPGPTGRRPRDWPAGPGRCRRCRDRRLAGRPGVCERRSLASARFTFFCFARSCRARSRSRLLRGRPWNMPRSS